MKHQVVLVFDTFAEFVDHAALPPRPAAKNGPSRRTSSSYGMPLMEAVRMAREGWQDGMKRVEVAIAAVQSRVAPACGPVEYRGMEGDWCDVDAYLTGEPECMIGTRFGEGSVKVVKVQLNTGMSGDCSDAGIMRRGAITISLVDALERAGISVELETSSFCSSGNGIIGTLVPLKRAGEPLEVDRLAFVLAHPAWHRRIVWSVRESDEWWQGEHSGPTHLPRSVSAPDITVPFMFTGHGDGDEGAVKWVLEQLREQGIEMAE